MNMTRERVRAIVQLQSAFGETAERLNSVVEMFAANDVEFDDVTSLTRKALVERVFISSGDADRFINAEEIASKIADRIDYERLSVIVRGDASWPTQTNCHPAAEMMPWLFVLGGISLLEGPAIGIGGSRQATSRSLEISEYLVRELVSRDVVVVSGGARGVDAAAHRTALEHGGKTVVVLAQGIGTFQMPHHWWSSIDRGQLAVVSEFEPMAGWESHQALQRNGTVVRLGETFLVVQAEEKSGTFSAGNSALRMKRPLHVVTQSGPGAERFAGSEQLIANGGWPLTVPIGCRSLEDVVNGLLDQRSATEAPLDQMPLF